LRVELNSTEQYPSLFQRLAIKDDILPSSAGSYPILPYDFACPTIHALLNRRTCGKCKKYFATIKSMKAHTVSRHSNEPVEPTRRLAVKRIAARRQRELMCVITSGEMEELEWHDQDDVDHKDEGAIPHVQIESGTPLKTIDVTFYSD